MCHPIPNVSLIERLRVAYFLSITPGATIYTTIILLQLDTITTTNAITTIRNAAILLLL